MIKNKKKKNHLPVPGDLDIIASPTTTSFLILEKIPPQTEEMAFNAFEFITNISKSCLYLLMLRK